MTLVKVVSKIKDALRQLARTSTQTAFCTVPAQKEADACSDSILSPSELQNGAINGETVLGPTALIVNHRQGAADGPAEGHLSLDLSSRSAHK